MARRILGVGFIGSGFMTRFHIRSWQGVRDADVRGVWSPNRERAEEAAALARELLVGDAKAYGSIEEMVADPAIDCIWICGPNFARLDEWTRLFREEQAVLQAHSEFEDVATIEDAGVYEEFGLEQL